MLHPRIVLAVLLLLWPATGWAGEDAPAASPLDALKARWLAAPTDVTLGVQLQDAMWKEGLRLRVRTLFRRASEAEPGDLALQFLYGRARQDKRGLALMREAFAQRLGNAAGETRNLLAAAIPLAVAEVTAGDGTGAAQAAEQITSLRGVAADWVYLAWIRQYLADDPARAEEAYRRALRVQNDHLGARIGLIRLLLARDESKEVLALAQIGVEQHPTRSAAHLQLGRAYAAAKQPQQAREAYALALEHAQGDVPALTATAIALVEADDPASAKKALAAALELDPRHGPALSSAGRLALAEDRLKDARKLLARAAKAQPKNARVAFFQGVCAQRMGLHTSAVSSFHRAVTLEPKRVEYLTALGLAHLEKGAPSSAVRNLKRAVELAPLDPDLRMQLGIAYMKKRAYKDARDAFQEAAERDRKNPSPYFYLAVIHGDKLGKLRDALEALTQYKALGGKAPAALAWLDELKAQLGK